MTTGIGAELNSPLLRNLAQANLQAGVNRIRMINVAIRGCEVTRRGCLFDQLSVVDECGIDKGTLDTARRLVRDRLVVQRG